MRKILITVLFLALITSCRKTDDINNNISRVYGDALEDIGYGITKAEGGYIISGQLTDVVRTDRIEASSSKKRLGLLKIDANGEVIWKHSYGNQLVNVGSKAIVLDDGSVVCTGHVIDSVTQVKDVLIVKTDSEGNEVSRKVFVTPRDIYNQYGIDILKTSTGFIVLGVTDAEKTGSSDSSGNIAFKKDILVMKLDENLAEIESWAAGYPGNDEPVEIKPDNGGGYIVVATTDRSDKSNLIQGKNNILLVKINSLGNFTQQRIIGGLEEENAAGIEVLDDGYLVVATKGTEASGQSGYAWKLSRNIFAAPVYEHSISLDDSRSFRINAIAKYKTNYFVMAGQAGTGNTSRMLVFITDDEGNHLPGKQVLWGSTGSQSVNAVLSDDDGNVYAVGKDSYENNSMISLLKFRF